LTRYRDDSLVAMQDALDPKRPLREGLARVYAKAIDVYLAGPHARGCFLIGTATTEAVCKADVRDVLRGSLQAFDRAIEDRLTLAVRQRELPPKADPAALAIIASAIMHSLAVRARGGEPREVLEALARTGIDLICSKGSPAR
jgi:AcrR family transcriptional regulator